MTARTSRTCLITADREAVWETLARFEDLSHWGRGVAHSSLLTRQATGLGAIRRVQVGRNALREQVILWEPASRLGYTVTGLPPLVRRVSSTWTLVTEAGGTRVTLASDVDTAGGPLVSRLVARRLAKAGEQLLAGLSDHHRSAAARS
jgi:hypothetical protein